MYTIGLIRKKITSVLFLITIQIVNEMKFTFRLIKLEFHHVKSFGENG